MSLNAISSPSKRLIGVSLVLTSRHYSSSRISPGALTSISTERRGLPFPRRITEIQGAFCHLQRTDSQSVSTSTFVSRSERLTDSPLQAGKAELKAALYLVATPIGNLEDITFRAVRVLRSVNLILAEDTRHSAKLLNHYGIKASMFSFHEHNESARLEKVIERLKQGSAVALISDAGTPLVSDPGAHLVKAVIASGLEVVPIPGPSAVLSALSVSGLPSERFTFCGFPPPKTSARLAAIENVKDETATLIFFMPPHKAVAVLEDFRQVLGGDRRCVLARELTKLHEEIWRGTLDEASDEFSRRDPKGEFTIVIEGKPASQRIEISEEEISRLLEAQFRAGLLPSAAAKSVALELRIPKNRVYAIASTLKNNS